MSKSAAPPVVGAAPEVATTLIAFNPYNPRESLGDVAELTASMQEHGQMQVITVVTREAFLKAHPHTESEIGPDALYVVVDGNRRRLAGEMAGLAKLKYVVDDSLAETAETMLVSALITGIHHQSFEPIDEARAIERLVDVLGSAAEVARHLSKTPGWVSQRRALLKLVPELQEEVKSGALTVKAARTIGTLPENEQPKAAAEARAARTRDKAAGPGKARSSGEQPTRVPAQASTGTADEQRGTTLPHAGTAAPTMRLGTPQEIATELAQHLAPAELEVLVEILMSKIEA
ncbi:ParB/RepB/Spo0J family partition protein [Yinghuangia aomiensis]|uniref:ParB/RepB/Spo0J family partition protein n=1 Tax=Yinghuangia aomiensis TaxID=676205 RepID=UPI0031E963DF